MADPYQDLNKATDEYIREAKIYGGDTPMPIGAMLGGQSAQRRETEKALIESPLQNELRRRRDVLQRRIDAARDKIVGIDFILNLFRD